VSLGPAGFRIRHLETAASTSDLVREAAGRDEPEGLWIVADEQTAGRGRHGRSWHSPPGNFHGSLLLRPSCSLNEAASLSLVVALAVAEAIHDLTVGRLTPRLKWPNDVLLGAAKVAGILLEGAEGPHRRCAWVVVGLGVNLRHHPVDAPYATTSLVAAGGPRLTPAAFLEALLTPLGGRLALWRQGGFAALRESWLAAAAARGELVRLQVGETARRGRFIDVDGDGALRLELGEGAVARFAAGELFFA
jgi:BirA family biotin operon repressor/biotin-[acetyl-CoA-carboxylase] ligase